VDLEAIRKKQRSGRKITAAEVKALNALDSAAPATLGRGRPRTIYNSMAQAAAAMGISIEAIKFAKRSGCDAIRGNGSINAAKLTAWIQENGNSLRDEDQPLRDQKVAEEVRKLKRQNEHEEGLLVSKSEAIAVFLPLINEACEILDNRLINEAVPRLVDSDLVPAVRAGMKREVDDAKRAIQRIGPALDKL
jgi:hypothetical protein